MESWDKAATEANDELSCEQAVAQVGARSDEGSELMKKLLKAIHPKDKSRLVPFCYKCSRSIRVSLDIWGTPVIAMVGGPSAGKTCYTGALWHQLICMTENRPEQIVMTPFPAEGMTYLNSIRDDLVFKRQIPIPTKFDLKEKKLQPCGINIHSYTHNTNKPIVIYDIAGDAFTVGESATGDDLAQVSRIAQSCASYISEDNVCGIVFMVDPYACPEISTKYKLPPLTDNQSQGRVVFSQGELLLRMASFLKLKQGLGLSDKIPRSIIISLTKLDIFLNQGLAAAINYREAYEDVREKLLDEALSSNLEWQSFEELHLFALKLFRVLGIQNLYDQAKEQFTDVHCFAISSFGHVPMWNRILIEEVKPQAVEVPFLWHYKRANRKELT
ncbi:MAG: hypothetical protein HZA90_18035 [Verrucomicrobia bacterium]|nr:hypothetical protein [Verrucomicrobiota bacterium]